MVNPDGNPVVNAVVMRNHVYTSEGESRPRVENKEYRTDARGMAIVELSGTSVDLRLWVNKESFPPLHAMWAKQFQADGDEIPELFTFQLQHGTEIGGWVKSIDGDPIEGVKVEVKDQVAAFLYRPRADEPGVRPLRSPFLGSAVTDAQGRWKLPNVPVDEDLRFDETDPLYLRGSRGLDRAPDRLLLKLSHPEFVDDPQWGTSQRGQRVTYDSLRDHTATIVMFHDR